MSASFDTRGRDAYWNATRKELRSIRKRGEMFTLIGAGVLLALIIIYRDRSREISAWFGVIALLLAVIGASQWFVTSRKRSVAVARGMVCAHCGYMPHDTEIDEVADTRACPRCERALDRGAERSVVRFAREGSLHEDGGHQEPEGDEA